MGNSPSSAIDPNRKGYHILKVRENSPAFDAGLRSYFHFIIAVNGSSLDDNASLFPTTIKNSVDHPVSLTVYSEITGDFAEYSITPRWWAQKSDGLIGCSIRYCDYQGALAHVWHIVDVLPNSPAHEAGLVVDTDYVVGTPDSVLREQQDFYTLIASRGNEGKPLKLFVYNSVQRAVRDIVLRPRRDWGGEGLIGAELGYGALHRIPVDRDDQSEDGLEHEKAISSVPSSPPPTLVPTATDAPPAGADASSYTVMAQVPSFSTNTQQSRYAHTLATNLPMEAQAITPATTFSAMPSPPTDAALQSLHVEQKCSPPPPRSPGQHAAADSSLPQTNSLSAMPALASPSYTPVNEEHAGLQHSFSNTPSSAFPIVSPPTPHEVVPLVAADPVPDLSLNESVSRGVHASTTSPQSNYPRQPSPNAAISPTKNHSVSSLQPGPLDNNQTSSFSIQSSKLPPPGPAFSVPAPANQYARAPSPAKNNTSMPSPNQTHGTTIHPQDYSAHLSTHASLAPAQAPQQAGVSAAESVVPHERTESPLQSPFASRPPSMTAPSYATVSHHLASEHSGSSLSTPSLSDCMALSSTSFDSLPYSGHPVSSQLSSINDVSEYSLHRYDSNAAVASSIPLEMDPNAISSSADMSSFHHHHHHQPHVPEQTPLAMGDYVQTNYQNSQVSVSSKQMQPTVQHGDLPPSLPPKPEFSGSAQHGYQATPSDSQQTNASPKQTHVTTQYGAPPPKSEFSASAQNSYQTTTSNFHQTQSASPKQAETSVQYGVPPPMSEFSDLAQHSYPPFNFQGKQVQATAQYGVPLPNVPTKPEVDMLMGTSHNSNQTMSSNSPASMSPNKSQHGVPGPNVAPKSGIDMYPGNSQDSHQDVPYNLQASLSPQQIHPTAHYSVPPSNVAQRPDANMFPSSSSKSFQATSSHSQTGMSLKQTQPTAQHSILPPNIDPRPDIVQNSNQSTSHNSQASSNPKPAPPTTHYGIPPPSLASGPMPINSQARTSPNQAQPAAQYSVPPPNFADKPEMKRNSYQNVSHDSQAMTGLQNPQHAAQYGVPPPNIVAELGVDGATGRSVGQIEESMSTATDSFVHPTTTYSSMQMHSMQTSSRPHLPSTSVPVPDVSPPPVSQPVPIQKTSSPSNEMLNDLGSTFDMLSMNAASSTMLKSPSPYVPAQGSTLGHMSMRQASSEPVSLGNALDFFDSLASFTSPSTKPSNATFDSFHGAQASGSFVDPTAAQHQPDGKSPKINEQPRGHSPGSVSMRSVYNLPTEPAHPGEASVLSYTNSAAMPLGRKASPGSGTWNPPPDQGTKPISLSRISAKGCLKKKQKMKKSN